VKLIYLLNSYSRSEASHFAHTMHLLESVAALGLEILLIIERCDEPPKPSSHRIRVTTLRFKQPGLRHVELMYCLRRGFKAGYDRVFVRIAIAACLCAIAARLGTRARVLYWQSGTTHAADRSQSLSRKKLYWFFFQHLPFEAVKNRVDRFVTGPHSMLDYYERAVGVDKNRLRNLSNDLDVSRFAPSELSSAARERIRGQCGLAPNDIMILMVHRLSPVRRTLFYMPFVISKLTHPSQSGNICTVVVGGGPELESLREAIAAQQLTRVCRLLASIPNVDVVQYYAAADIFINPSYAEGFPRVILEAMAAGLPIVSTDAGGTIELVGKDQASFVVSKDDREGFGRKLQQLVNDSALRERLSAENRDSVRRYDTQFVAREFLELLAS
jgi:glycosyltransferase involved in cell wall biosynthesis